MICMFTSISFKIRLDPTRFFTTTELAWQAPLKKDKVKLDILTNINIILMVEKAIRGGKCYAIY